MVKSNNFDCLVVGGGLIGMLTARELVRAGVRVAVLERGRTGRESTWAGGGILSPLYPWRYPAGVNLLARWSQDVYADLAVQLQEESGIDPEYVQNGLLILDPDERAAALTWADTWQRRLEVVDRSGIQNLEPHLGDVPEVGLWLPEVGQLRNPRLAEAVRKSIENQGAKIFEHTPVEGLVVHGDSVQGVTTPQGVFIADKVVIAGGAWSAQLLGAIGLQLPVRPVRGQMILYRTRPGLVARILLSQGRYVIPRRDGRVLVGSTMEEVGFNKTTTTAALEELQHEAHRLIPTLAEYPVEHHWAGLRPGSPTGTPYICEHPGIEGLFLNTGHFRNGVVMGPASARLLADLLLVRTPILATAPFRMEEA
jgi:glycine oxidase